MTERALSNRGYNVQACEDVAKARAAFASSDPPHDLVLSDVVLPDGRGSDLVYDLLKERPGMAAILVTGYTDERADWERAREEGVELLMKPVGMAKLLKQVSLALERRGDV
jgi:DNA-binding NtrC family response regulator